MTDSTKPASPSNQESIPPADSTLSGSNIPETGRVTQNPFLDTAAGSDAAGSSGAPASSGIAPSVNPTTKPSQSPPTATETPPGDPRVASLRAMFPDYDEATLLMILESANWNEENALEILLGMNDPNYKPETRPTAPPAETMTQEELDEQLARRLMLEEQENQARWYDQQGRRPHRRNSRAQDDAYQAGQGAVAPGMPGQQGPAGGNNTMAEIQDSLTKAAEVGKKTLGGLFTKVKAKIQEFEQGRSSGTSDNPQWVGGYDPQFQQQQGEYAAYQPHHGSAAGHAAGPGSASPPQASYYDPNAQSPAISEQTFSPPSRTPAPAVQGYDVSPNALDPARANSPAAAGSSTTAGAPSVPPPSSAAPIDGGKLGLLPKRPVSLVRDQQPRRSLDDDDGLEYAENPFEEQKK